MASVARRCWRCSARWASCCSSPAPTSPISSWSGSGPPERAGHPGCAGERAGARAASARGGEPRARRGGRRHRHRRRARDAPGRERAQQEALPRLQPIGMEWPILGFAVSPRSSPRCSRSRPGAAGRVGSPRRLAGRGGAGRRRRAPAASAPRWWLRRRALPLILLTGAGLTLKSLHQLLRVDLGREPAGLLERGGRSAGIEVPGCCARPGAPAGLHRAGQRLPRRPPGRTGASAAGIRAAGASSGLPLGGGSWSKYVVSWDRPLPASLGELPRVEYRVVAGDTSARRDAVRGRASPADDLRGPRVAIVSRELAGACGGTRTRWASVSR